MVDEATPGGPPIGSLEELSAVWDHFRSGKTVACPSDGSPMALSVDGAGSVYRLVCTRCGVASSWFESGPAGVVLRTGPGKAQQAEGG